MNKKALILLWEKYQDVEGVYSYYRLQEDFDVEIGSNKPDLVYGINGVKLPSHIHLFREGAQIDCPNFVAQYSLLVIVGGVISVEYARQNSTFIEILKEFNRQNKIIASCCHGAQYLIEAGLTKGKKISGYYSIKTDITNSGAHFIDAPFVIDGNIISCPHYKFQHAWMKEAIKMVYGNESTK